MTSRTMHIQTHTNLVCMFTLWKRKKEKCDRRKWVSWRGMKRMKRVTGCLWRRRRRRSSVSPFFCTKNRDSWYYLKEHYECAHEYCYPGERQKEEIVSRSGGNGSVTWKNTRVWTGSNEIFPSFCSFLLWKELLLLVFNSRHKKYGDS